jgi:hypothetical protein
MLIKREWWLSMIVIDVRSRSFPFSKIMLIRISTSGIAADKILGFCLLIHTYWQPHIHTYWHFQLPNSLFHCPKHCQGETPFGVHRLNHMLPLSTLNPIKKAFPDFWQLCACFFFNNWQIAPFDWRFRTSLFSTPALGNIASKKMLTASVHSMIPELYLPLLMLYLHSKPWSLQK